MLYDTLENLNQYTGLFPNLDKAIDFIEDNDVSALPLGRTEIDGDDVYVTVMEAEPTPGEGRAFETHSRYMDLQMDLEGAELCEVALGDVEEAEPMTRKRILRCGTEPPAPRWYWERAGSQCLWWRSRISLPLRRRAAIR